MRIGVITLSDSADNYGQLLQCYALQEYLKEQGHAPYLIRYIPSKSPMLERIRTNLSWKKIHYYFSAAGKQERESKQQFRAKNSLLNKQREFEAFRKHAIETTPITYHSIQELRRNPPPADIYICGSDQVWGGVYELANTAALFLDFGDKKTKRVSYAASMGGKPQSLTTADKRRLKSFLKRFDAISVREASAQTVCRELGYTNTELVLDPTLLPQTQVYNRLFDNITPSSNPYLFIYILNVETKEELHWDAIKSYTTTNQCEIKATYSSGYVPARDILPGVTGLQATLPQWLAYICHAHAVMTTSFHGIVLSILMRKPFLAILLTNQYAAGNVRIVDLLHSLGLSHRIYDPTKPLEAQMGSPIDWQLVEGKLETLRHDSQAFINTVLSTQ